MNPDALTDQLELFLDVLDTGSFSAAARRHPLTPSAVARRIDALERALGIHFLNADVYFIDYLPSQLLLADVLMVCAAALLLSFLATLYPAWRAARTQPAEALRYE